MRIEIIETECKICGKLKKFKVVYYKKGILTYKTCNDCMEKYLR